MELLIRLDDDEPPAGTVVVVPDGQAPGLPFAGWLGLLRALADAIAEARRSTRD